MDDRGVRPLDARTRRTLLRAIPLSLVVAVASLLLFAWIANEVLEQGTRRFDDQLRTVVHQHSSPPLTVFMRGVTLLGSREVLLPVVLLGLAALLVRGKRQDAIQLAVTMTGAVVLEVMLKLSYHRPRPDPFFNIPPPHSYAFPSGHALASLCFYSMVAWMMSERLEKRWRRVAVWIVAGLLIGLIGLSRIYLGVHYASDVLGGYAAATVWMGAVETVFGRMRRRERIRRARDAS